MSRQLRFCRILKGIAVGGGSRLHASGAPTGSWRPTPRDETFTVFLNEARTRLIRSSRHTPDCVRCGGYHTTEISLEDIHRAVA